MTLTEFLAARLDEDEAAAQSAGNVSNNTAGVGPPGPPGPFGGGGGAAPSATAAGGARMLREVAAKRRILELHDRAHECSVYSHGDVDSGAWVDDGETCSTLRVAAAVWSGHPDYDETWAP